MGSCLSTCACVDGKQSPDSLGFISTRSRGSDGPAAAFEFGRLPRGAGLGEDELQRIPGRMFVNGASSFACLYTQQGRKGTNQDAMLVWEIMSDDQEKQTLAKMMTSSRVGRNHLSEPSPYFGEKEGKLATRNVANFGPRSDTIFCGVFDGHGPSGHMVAKKVRDSLPLKLCAQWKANIFDQNGMHENNSVLGSMNSEETASLSMDDESAESLNIDENEKLPQIYLTLKKSLLKAFKLMDKELKLHQTIDCFCSGTTAVTLVKQGQDLIIGNVGDSRAVLGTREKDHTLVAVQLTVDLKPNLPREAARIQQCKGRVFALQDEPEVARVWLPNNDSPGLAMARAFGDFCLKDYGLISVPDISYHRITEGDEFVVLATDGVWDVFSNKEVVDIVASAPSRATAARALVDSAVRAWRLKFPTSKADDCAVVCLFLDPPSPSVQVSDTALKETPHEVRVKEASNLTKKEHANGELERFKPPISDMAWVQASALEQPNASQSADEIVPVPESKGEKLPNRCQSTRSLAECISTTEEEEWSALEGVTRVNSLVNLPRFGPGDKKSTSWRKWL